MSGVFPSLGPEQAHREHVSTSWMPALLVLMQGLLGADDLLARGSSRMKLGGVVLKLKKMEVVSMKPSAGRRGLLERSFGVCSRGTYNLAAPGRVLTNLRQR